VRDEFVGKGETRQEARGKRPSFLSQKSEQKYTTRGKGFQY